jgi:hypothetical protein
MDWKACFGQHGTAQLHLSKQGVEKGDVFLFFGWFRHTEIVNGELRFKEGSQDLQIIYGYMQIGEVVKQEEIKKYYWHPHAQEEFIKNSHHNTLYVASPNLLDTNLPGFGTFKFSEDVVLTKEGYSRSKWELPSALQESELTYHSQASKKADYFQSARIGQEFVIKADYKIKEWIIKLVQSHQL